MPPVRPVNCARAATLAALSALSALVIGCSGPQALPDIEPGLYAGPPLDLDASRAQYIVVAHAPTPGWVVGLDRVAEQYRHQAVFITLRRPNPAFMYPQVEVEQRIATTVGTAGPIVVYARLLNPEETDTYSPYVLASQSASLNTGSSEPASR